MAQVLIFGDSLVFGFWDREGGWVDRLKLQLTQKSLDSNLDNYCPIFNLGIPGDTTQDLLERFEFESKQRVNGFEKSVFIFGVGGNDCQYILSEQRHKVFPEQFVLNVNRLINLAKKFSNKVVFVGLCPVDESRTDPLFWMPDRSFKNEYVRKYNEILQKACQQLEVHFINIFDSIFADHYVGLLEDGLHLTSVGHKKVFEIIENYLIQNEII